MNIEVFVKCYDWENISAVLIISAITLICAHKKITPVCACEMVTEQIEKEHGPKAGQRIHERLKPIPNFINLLESSFGDEYRRPKTQGGNE